MLFEHDIVTLYQGLLQREPDDEAVQWMKSAFTTPAQATRYLLDSAEFTRLDRQRPIAAVGGDEKTSQALALTQLKDWIRFGCDMAAAEKIFERTASPSRFILDLDGGRVSVRPRFGLEPHPRDAGFVQRSDCYAKLISDVSQLYGITDRSCFFFDMDDLITEVYYMPVCNYQRTSRQSTICFPDIEFLTHDFYETQGPADDNLPFFDKANRASFIGSTTGYPYLLGKHNLLLSPRLKSALFFKDRKEVDFTITNIIQTDGFDTETAILELGIVTSSRRFETLYDNKFVISMDGNGATCSRVAMALRSNSVLLKYNSESDLYYFSMLIPWLHYIPIENDEDVLRIVDHEDRNPGAYAHIAAASTEFYHRYLSRRAIYQYTAHILKLHNKTFYS